MTRVLVIDDDLSIRELIAYALGDEGYQVDQASDGEAALEQIDRQHPDIILLDMKMPGIDGWEFAKLYRERYDQRAPIIVVTAAKDAAQRGSTAEAASYLSKPFDLDMLIGRVSAIARRVGTN
ncbi:MAG TPA: response regulator transcription factor [Chloroflexia bacterium]|nr:response regulator transcription factor [Chloroflexia bacterium]